MSAPAAPTGAIHDLGYKRYLGTRRPQSTRWRVIVRNQLGNAWKTWWRYKMALGWSVVAMVVFGALIYTYRALAGGLTAPTMRFGIHGNLLDGLTALSIKWFCYAAFLVGLTVGSGTIAADRQVGAFTFYFSRPVRPIDYVLGKFGGLFLLQLVIIGAPLVLVTAFRCGMSDTDEMLRTLPLVGKAALIGVLGALVYTAVPLALSSLVARRRNAIALWATFYLVVSNIAFAVGVESTPSVMPFDLQTAVTSLGPQLFGVRVDPFVAHVAPLGASLVAIAIYTIGGFVVTWWQIRQQAGHGVGGA